jgi:hypothetical protein
MKEHYRQIEDFFASIVAEGQKSGTFSKAMSPQAAAWQFIMSGIGYAMVSLNLGMIDRSAANQVIDAMLRGLRN